MFNQKAIRNMAFWFFAGYSYSIIEETYLKEEFYMKTRLGVFAGFLAGIASFSSLGYLIGFSKGASKAYDECIGFLEEFNEDLRKKYPHLYEEEES